MEQSLTELFNELLTLETWLDNNCENQSYYFTMQLRERLDKIKELKNKVQSENQKMN